MMKLRLPITLYSSALNRFLVFFTSYIGWNAPGGRKCIFLSAHAGIHKINRYRHECQKEVQMAKKGRDGFTTGAGKMKLVKMMERRVVEQ